MKYIKLIRLYDYDNETISEIQDVPLNRIITASLHGTMLKDGTMKAGKSFSVKVSGKHLDVDKNVIYKVYVPGLMCKDGTCDWMYVFDAAAERRILIGELGATSMPELILKLTLHGLIYSTDSVLMDIPEAVRQVAELKGELMEKNREIAELREKLEDTRSRLAAAEDRANGLAVGSQDPSVKNMSRWKRMIEGIFGSEGDESLEI